MKLNVNALNQSSTVQTRLTYLNLSSHVESKVENVEPLAYHLIVNLTNPNEMKKPIDSTLLRMLTQHTVLRTQLVPSITHDVSVLLKDNCEMTPLTNYLSILRVNLLSVKYNVLFEGWCRRHRVA